MAACRRAAVLLRPLFLSLSSCSSWRTLDSARWEIGRRWQAGRQTGQVSSIWVYTDGAIVCVRACVGAQLKVLTLELAFKGAMLARSQYAPSSNSDPTSWRWSRGVGEAVVCGDVGADASLMLWMISWTSASVGGGAPAAAISLYSGSGACPLDSCSVVPFILDRE